MFEFLTATVGFTVFALLLAVVILCVRYFLVPSVSVPIVINNNQTIESQYAQTLLDALSGNSVHLPSACAGAGTCGLCRIKLESEVSTANSIEQALLTQKEMDDGYRLACQVILRNPTEVELPEDVLNTRSWQAKVLSNRALSPLIREIQLEAETDIFEFTPGYFMQVTAPAGQVMLRDIDPGVEHKAAWDTLGLQEIGVQSDTAQTRAYSLANRPNDNHSVTLMIRLALPDQQSVQTIPPGYVSSWLFTRCAGDTVELSGPHQGFHIEDESRELVFVGGGVGMAPLRSMIHQQIDRLHPLPMTFFYGARTESDLLYSEEFNGLSDANNGFTWTPALSEPDSQWHGESGFVHTVFENLFLSEHKNLHNCDFYLCGPPLMIQATVAVLVSAGVEKKQIFKDEFG